MFWPLIQISPICPSGSSVAVSVSTMTAHSCDADLARGGLRDRLGESSGTSTNVPVFSCVAIDRDDLRARSADGVVDTNSVASARP